MRAPPISWIAVPPAPGWSKPMMTWPPALVSISPASVLAWASAARSSLPNAKAMLSCGMPSASTALGSSVSRLLARGTQSAKATSTIRHMPGFWSFCLSSAPMPGSRLPAVQVLCSRADLGRILVNLLTNAARALGDPHAPAGERVCVRAYEEQGRIYVDVSDDGPGIPEALRGGLFERGAGLAESRRLAVANGGDLELLSGDGGSSFRLTLAVSRVGQAGAERPVVA